MNILTQKQVEELGMNAGFSRKNARIASAIAMCEAPYSEASRQYSNFDAVGDQALANETWGYSYGGFQIRSLRAQKGTGGIRDEEKLIDPEFNVLSARAIKLDTGWKAWSTFVGGQYKAYLQDLYPPPPNTYIVVGGDSLSKIAAKYGWFTWQELAKTNNLIQPYTIFIGQHLLLPFNGHSV